MIMNLRKRQIILCVLLTFVLFVMRANRTNADGIALVQTVQASQTASYSIEIQNETTVEHTYSLALTGLPESLKATFTQGGPLLDQISIPANDYRLVTLRIEVPADTPIDHYTAMFTATRDDHTVLSIPLSLNVENLYSVRIISQNINLTTFNGQEFTFEATASNTGAASVTNVKLKVDAPAKWVVQSEPSSLATLEAGQSATYRVKVLVPTSQVSIDQPINLSLSSEQAESPPTELTVRVQNSPNYLYVAFGVVLLTVVGVFVYFRYQGRR